VAIFSLVVAAQVTNNSGNGNDSGHGGME